MTLSCRHLAILAGTLFPLLSSSARAEWVSRVNDGIMGTRIVVDVYEQTYVRRAD